jgi:hypothetical protein
MGRENYYRGLGWPGTDWNDETVLQMLETLATVRSTSASSGLSSDTELNEWLDNLGRQLVFCSGRRIVNLEKNQIGLYPESCQDGDFVCVLHGANLPIVLRKLADKWELIGPCFVDGMMYGEAVDWREDDADIFTLL